MYDRYLVKEGSLRNEVRDGRTVGFQFDVHVGGCRGCFLSLVRGYYVNVDGTEYPADLQRFEVNGRTRTYEELGQCPWEHWDYDDWATIHVAREGGLAPGGHRLTILQDILTSWMDPEGAWGALDAGGRRPFVFELTVA